MDPLTRVPAQLVAGDRYDLLLTYSDYPASDGWSLRFGVAGAGVDEWQSSPSGDAHALVLPVADTTLLPAGTYNWRVRAEKAGGYATTLETGTLSVAADLGQAAPGELADYWEQVLTAAQSALSSILAGGGGRMLMIQGRQWMFEDPERIIRVIAYAEQRIATRRGSFGTPVRMTATGFTS